MFYEKERGKRIWSRFKDWDKKEFSEEDTGKTKAKKKQNKQKKTTKSKRLEWH